MKVIAIEEHAFPKDVLDGAGIDLGPRAGRRLAALHEFGEERVRLMEDAGVDVQILSAGLGNVIQALEPDDSARFSASINDQLAAAVDAFPNRFRAFASLPMCDPAQAVEELRRAVGDLGHVGAMIHGPTHGVFLDDDDVAPVLACAQEFDVPIYLHPAPPPPAVKEAYFAGLQPDLSLALSTAGWGWHAECGMHVLRMVLGGVFQRFERLQVIVGHMGENLPFSLDRADDMIGHFGPDKSISVRETVLSHVHISTCGYHTDAPMRCALDVFGPDRIMFSVDHPFGNSEHAVDFLTTVPLNPGEREKIAHGNAERLLRL